MGFQMVPILLYVILRYSTTFSSFGSQLCKSGWR